MEFKAGLPLYAKEGVNRQVLVAVNGHCDFAKFWMIWVDHLKVAAFALFDHPAIFQHDPFNLFTAFAAHLQPLIFKCRIAQALVSAN